MHRTIISGVGRSIGAVGAVLLYLVVLVALGVGPMGSSEAL